MTTDIATLPALLPYALAYAARGWPVFPLHTPGPSGRCSCGKDCSGNCGKHPRTAHGLKEATTDQAVIRSWWAKWPDANIGVLTGEKSQLLVIDVDPKNAGDATWDRLLQEHDSDPDTLTVETGSGGLHAYYQRPNDCGKIKSRANAIPPGVDCKCDGGYVVAPPSLHFSGRRYLWRNDSRVQPAPTWLLRLVCSQPTRAAPGPVSTTDTVIKRARAYLSRMPPSISGSGGHDAAWKAAIAMVRGFGLAQSDALGLLLGEFNGRCDPPWSEAELRHKVVDAEHASDLPHGYLLVTERTSASSSAAPPSPAFDPEPDLDRDRNGTVLKTLPNAIAILAHDRDWRGVLGYDAFACREVFRRPPPWYGDDAPASHHDAIEDADEGRAIAWIQRRHGVSMRREIVRDAMTLVAQRQSFHPVRDYLEKCATAWDGAERMPTAASVYFGADVEDQHARAGLYRWLIAAVKRVYEPGCQSDSMLVLEGEQGIRKSSGLRVLASTPWFADDIGDPGNKDAADALRGKWVVEIGELRWRKSDEDTRKAFLSRRVDHYRPAYGHRTLDVPRQCVLAATTNQRDWQTDASGARRYWALACSVVDLEAIARDRDQIWGEALRRHRAGEQSWLTDEEAAIQRQALHERREADPWEESILEWASGRGQFAIEDVLAMLNIDQAKRTVGDGRRVGAILRRNGFTQRRASGRASRTRLWCPHA